MRIYRISVTGDRYPTEYTIQASSWATAVSRAVREWSKRFKGSRTGELRIKAIKGGQLITEKESG